MTSLYQTIPHPVPDGDPEKIARAAIRSLNDKGRGEILLELLVRYVREEQRAEAKRAERRAYNHSDDRRWWKNRRKEIDRLRVEEPDEYERRYTIAGAIRTFNEEIRKEIRLEITAELLATSFALGDGRSVTWGEATVQDHQARLQVLTGNVIGNFETMELHEQAIDLIRTQGIQSLGDAPRAVAA